MNRMTLIHQLHEIGAVKFGEFRLKSGILSPFYIDLRLIVSYPDLLQAVSEAFWEQIEDLTFDRLCGVPYTALPIATAISLTHRIPMIMKRREVKDYGTKRIIEGVYNPGERCLIVEDLVTSGASILETVAPLVNEGLTVKDVVVLIDREQGGRQRLEDSGYRLHAVFTISDFLSALDLPEETLRGVQTFLKKNQTFQLV